MTLRQLRAAETEAEEAAAYYESQRAGLGREFKDELHRAYDAIVEFPNRGLHIGEDLQRYLLKRFEYGIIYSIRQDLVLIIAVAHLRRQQNYWRDRLP